MGLYWIFFIITCVGFILSFMELKLDNYEYNIINVKNDNNGFITNTSVDINNDPIPVKIIKPNIFSIDSENNINVIYKKDNMKTMYYLYDTNIGLHIFYVGSSYLYSYSSIIFIFLLIGAIFFEIIPSVIKLSNSK